MCQSASRVKLILGLSSTSKVEDLWITRLGTAYCHQTPFSLIVVPLSAMQNSSHLISPMMIEICWTVLLEPWAIIAAVGSINILFGVVWLFGGLIWLRRGMADEARPSGRSGMWLGAVMYCVLGVLYLLKAFHRH